MRDRFILHEVDLHFKAHSLPYVQAVRKTMRGRKKFNDAIPPPGGWNPKSAKKKLEDIISDIKKALDAQPGVHVDDLIF